MVFISVTEEFDVLRIVEHQKKCYVSSDCIRGRTIAAFLKEGLVITKGELWHILQKMSEALAMYHKSDEHLPYQYVNPYSFIVDEKHNVFLLDLSAERNRERIVFMQKRALRECFLPPGDDRYQHASRELDIYGLGKCIQYVLAFAGPDPPLSIIEELRLRILIQKCLTDSEIRKFKSVHDIQKNLPKIRKNKKTKTRKKRKLCVLLIILAGLCFFLLREVSVKIMPDDVNQEEYKPVEMRAPKQEEPLGQEEVPDKPEKRSGAQFFLDFMEQEGYKWVNDKEKAGAVFCLGEGYVYSLQDAEEIKNLAEYLAQAAVTDGREEEAAQYYRVVLDKENQPKKKEELYKRIIAILRSCGDNKALLETCVEGCEALKESDALKIELIRAICLDEGQSRAEKEESISRLMEEITSPGSNRDLLQVLNENRIKYEGGIVCFKE